MDQAGMLRNMVKKSGKPGPDGENGEKTGSGRLKKKEESFIQVIAVTSGKGGVGKTNVVANLGYALTKLDKRVLILDADMGLANLDVLLGLTPKYNFVPSM